MPGRLPRAHHILNGVIARQARRFHVATDITLLMGREGPARADRIAGNPGFCHLQGDVSGETDEGRLGRGVVSLVARAEQSKGRRDVDDTPPVTIPHMRDRQAYCVKRTRKIDRQRPIPPGHRHVLDGNRLTALRFGRAVDEDVYSIHLSRGGGHEGFYLLRYAHIGRDVCRRCAVSRLDFHPHAFDLVRIAESVQHHVASRGRQCLGDGVPDAAG